MLDTRDLSSFEHHGCLHLVPIQQKSPGVPRFEIEIVSIRVGMETEFLQERDMLMLLLKLVFLRLLVLELTVADNLAYGWLGSGNDLHEVGIAFSCQENSLPYRHHAKLSSVMIDNPDLGSPDFIIDAGSLFCAYGLPPSVVNDFCWT